MNYQRAVLLLGLLIPAFTANARTEIALIPKIGYVSPMDNEQELNGTIFHFDDGQAYGAALELRHMFGKSDTSCGFAVGPEYLEYTYKSRYDFGGQQRTGEATNRAFFIAPKFMCASKNARYSLGIGIGNAHNYIDIGDRQIVIKPANTFSSFYQYTAAAEFGGERFRVHTELRYLGNPDNDEWRQYNGSGFGGFLGVSLILRKLPPPKRPRNSEF